MPRPLLIPEVSLRQRSPRDAFPQVEKLPRSPEIRLRFKFPVVGDLGVIEFWTEAIGRLQLGGLVEFDLDEIKAIGIAERQDPSILLRWTRAVMEGIAARGRS